MRIDLSRTSALPAVETKEAAPVTNRRLPQTQVSLKWGDNLLPALELGLELEATVTDELANGKLLLQVGSSLIEADGPGGLSAGQSLKLRVEQLQPQIVLQITQAEPSLKAEATRLLRQHLPVHADEGQLLDNLQRLLTLHLSKEPNGAEAKSPLAKLHEAITHLVAHESAVQPETVQSLLQDGGIFYEAKLAQATQHDPEGLRAIADQDLKGLLLAALSEAIITAPAERLTPAITAQLNNLETQQAANLLAQVTDGSVHLQIPFFNGASFSTAAVAIERDGKGNAGTSRNQSGGYGLLFLLDLENFGRTRIDAHVHEQSLRVMFYVDRDSSVVSIKEELPQFRQLLQGLGYQDVLLAARPLRDIPEDKRQKFDALAVGAPPSIHLLDMKA